MRKHYILFLILFFVIMITSACNSKEQEEIFIIPHHFNLKTYSYEIIIDLAFVTKLEIKTVENVGLFLRENGNGGFDSVDIKDIFELESYNSFNIFVIRLVIRNIHGDILINSIEYDYNSKNYSFNTDIRIQGDFHKEVHFTSGNNSGDIIIPGFADYGFSQVLKSNKDIKIVSVYFEGTKDFDTSQFISNIYFNSRLLDNNIVLENDPFYLEITIKNTFPRDTMIIDQIVIEYQNIDDQSLDFAYVMVPLSLYSTKLCSQYYIDSLI